MDCKTLGLQQGRLTAECQLIYQEVKILTYGQYHNITPGNKKSE